MTTEELLLLQFPYSHYNEKARWALDFKGLPHRRENLLPGPHAPRIKRLTGKTQTPVLLVGDRLVSGSAEIIKRLEQLKPEPALYPDGPELRTQALALARHFDEEVGPRVRRALFAILLNSPGYVCQMFTSDRSLATRVLYRATFPLVKGVMKRSMGITGEAAIRDARAGVWEACEMVAGRGGDGYLVGDRFSVADLTAAALLAPIADPPDSTMTKPRPMPPSLEAFIEEWSTHPGVAWVRRIYQQHRTAAAPPAGAGRSLTDPCAAPGTTQATTGTE